jgi:O-antigen ligase
MLSDATTIRRNLPQLMRLRRPGIPWVAVAAIAFGIVAAAAAGIAASGGHVMFAAPFVACAVIVLFVRAPQLPFAMMILFASTFAVVYSLPKAGSLYPAEAIMFLGFVALPLLGRISFGGIFGVALGLFLLAVVFGIVAATGHGVSVHDALLEARTPALYASFWIALAAIRENRRRFVVIVGAAAVAVALLAILQFLLPSRQIFMTAGVQVVTPDNGFLRVRPPGLMFAYFGAIFGLAYLFWGPKRHRLRAALLVVLFSTAVVISLNRNMIVGMSAGLLVAFLVLPGRAQAGVKILATVAAAVALIGISGHGTVVQRILSLGNASYLQRTTLADRTYEDAFARATIARHPISGIGWGVTYGANIRDTGGIIRPRSFVHDQYYELWLKTGLLGLVSYVFLLGAAALAGIRLVRRGEARQRWIGAAVVGSVVAFAASSVVGAYIIDAGSTPAVVALLAIAASWPTRVASMHDSAPDAAHAAA